MLHNLGVFCLGKLIGTIGKDVVWNNASTQIKWIQSKRACIL